MFCRPPGFVYRNNLLCGEEIPLQDLARKYGTPLYVYSAGMIRERFRLFDQAFAKIPHTVCYSVKANSNVNLLRMLAQAGAGFDIVSGGELERVARAEKKALRRTVFSGVGKTADEMRAALRSRILLFNVESEQELEALEAEASRLRLKAPVALRVNPDVPAETHPYISTGLREHKFGVPIKAARELYRKAARSKHLRVAGVSLHIGSQITDVAPFAAAVQRVVELVNVLHGDGCSISFLDAGGGLGIPYNSAEPIEFALILQQYATAIIAAWEQVSGAKPKLLLEPGRSIVGPAGVLLTRVLYQKQNGAKRFTIVDAAMNDLLRPALYGARHELIPVRISGSQSTVTADVVGPVCESGDFLLRDASLPELKNGDYLCVLDTGAYGMALASNYNTRPRPAEVVVDGKKSRMIRRRETVADLLRAEIAR